MIVDDGDDQPKKNKEKKSSSFLVLMRDVRLVFKSSHDCTWFEIRMVKTSSIVEEVEKRVNEELCRMDSNRSSSFLERKKR